MTFWSYWKKNAVTSHLHAWPALLIAILLPAISDLKYGIVGHVIVFGILNVAIHFLILLSHFSLWRRNGSH